MHIFQYSDAGFALTKHFEGDRLEAYQDCGGVWTIGYGHTGPDVKPGRKISQFEAEAILRADLTHAQVAVNQLVRAPMTQGQFDAMVDFAFNDGIVAFRNSTLLRKFNAGDTQGAALEFPKWDHAGGREIEGLRERRLAEQALFLQAA